MKKYLIRLIGALCILGALALIFLPSSIRMDGVKKRDLRDYSSNMIEIIHVIRDDFIDILESDQEMSEDFQEELEDADLPSTRSKLKARFKEVDKLADILLNDQLALKDVLVFSIKTPDLLEDLENLSDSRYVSNTLYYSASSYVVHQNYQYGLLDSYDLETVDATAEMYRDSTEDSIEGLSDFAGIFTAITWTLIVFVVLGVLSAMTHMFNKVRWVKYLFLVLLIVLVVGLCIAAPLVSDLISDSMMNTPIFEDISLKVTFAPFIAVVLAAVPVVLDIIFERKKY